eukprot:GGOE01007255.1.p1 GENE.GGOE01007255.1~~GGOE01007255.1.p1  ORF type:complete len:850 (-),score=270.64 GGOE01007255.1:577-3126(-)
MRLFDGLTGTETPLPTLDVPTIGNLLDALSTGNGVEDRIILLTQDGLTCHRDQATHDQDVVYFFTQPSAMDLLPPSYSPPTAPFIDPSANPPACSIVSGELLKQRTVLWRQWQEAAVEAQWAEQQAAAIMKLQQQSSRQADAARCVGANLMQYYDPLVRAVASLQADYAERVDQYEDLLATFPDDLDRLHSTPLLPALGHHSQWLLDLLISDSRTLEPWQRKCQEEWERVKEIMAGLSTQLKEMKAAVEQEKSFNGPNPIPSPPPAVTEGAVDEARALAEQCETHYRTAMGGTALDASVFADLQRKFEQVVRPKLQANRRQLGRTLADLQRAHVQAFTSLAGQLQRIVQHQSHIHALQRRLPLFRRMMSKLDDHFQVLRQCHHLPEAYQWGLLEAVRRRGFARLCLQRVAQTQEALGRLLGSEAREREQFQQQYGCYLPPQIIPGLQEPLPCEQVVAHLREQLRSFTSDLPPIDTPEQVTAFFEGLPWDRELGEPPDGLLPANLAQLIGALPTDTATSPRLSDPLAANSVSGVARIAVLEATVARLEGQLREERERQVVAVEASSTAYLDTLQRMAQSTHFEIADLASPSGLEALEAHIAQGEQFRQAVHRIAERCHTTATTLPGQGQDPSAVLAALVGEVGRLREAHAALQPVHQRYRQALDALSASLDLPSTGPMEAITLATLDDVLNSVMDLREQNALLRTLAEVQVQGPRGRQLAVLTDFAVGDTAIFVQRGGTAPPILLPGSSSNSSTMLSDSGLEGPCVFEAVHSGTPHWFLAEESTSALFRRYPSPPSFVIIRIVSVDDGVATTERNLYGLPPGTAFHEVLGEWVYDPLRSDVTEGSSSTKP